MSLNRLVLKTESLILLEVVWSGKQEFSMTKIARTRNGASEVSHSGEGGDRGSLWYRYQLIRYQVPPKLKVLVPSILGEGANS